MHLYDSHVQSPEEIAAALKVDGAILALDIRQFEVVVTHSGIMLQLKSSDPGLPLAVPANAFRIMFPHLPQFVAPPKEALSFAVADHLHVGGTSK